MTTSPRKSTRQPGQRVTSLTLPLPLWQALKIRAVQEGRSLNAVVLAAVERYLEERYLEPDTAPGLPEVDE